MSSCCDDRTNPPVCESDIISIVPPCDGGTGSLYVPDNSCTTLLNQVVGTYRYDGPQIGATGELSLMQSSDVPSEYLSYCCQGFPGSGSDATYNQFGQSYSGPCCLPDGDVVNGSYKPVFSRTAYTGEHIQCCLNNNVCDQAHPSSCYSDRNLQNTCAPEFRDITSPSCQNTLLPLCTGSEAKGDDISWINNWTTGMNGTNITCHNYIQKLLFQQSYNTVTGQAACLIPSEGIGCTPFRLETYPTSAAGLAAAQNIVQQAITQYNKQGFRLGSQPGSTTYTPFQDAMKDLCCKYPTLCEQSIKQNCITANVARLSLNPTEQEWCGCYLPDEAYTTYINTYNINKECTPMCNGANNIPLTDPDGNPTLCQQNVCLIDDVTINIIKSNVQGTVNIAQFCGGCQSQQDNPEVSSCVCILDNATLDIINTEIGGDVNIAQQCGNTVCTRRATPAELAQGLPPVLQIPCTGSNNYNPYEQYQQKQEEIKAKQQTSLIVWIILIIVVFLVVLFLIILFFGR